MKKIILPLIACIFLTACSFDNTSNQNEPIEYSVSEDALLIYSDVIPDGQYKLLNINRTRTHGPNGLNAIHFILWDGNEKRYFIEYNLVYIDENYVSELLTMIPGDTVIYKQETKTMKLYK